MRKFIQIVESATPHQWHHGDTAYYEYHCNPSHQSEDAPLWYRSHQTVMVVDKDDTDIGEPEAYQVVFPDGFVGCAFEDELFGSPEQFDSQYAPPPADEIEAHRPLTETSKKK